MRVTLLLLFVSCTTPKSTLITMEAGDRPVRDVFQELQDRIPFELNLDGIEDQRIHVDIRGATPFQALDDVCRAAGLGYTLGPRLKFGRGEWGVTFYHGAYRVMTIHPWSMMKDEKITVGVIIELAWTPDTRPEKVALMEITSIVNDRGEELGTLQPKPIRNRTVRNGQYSAGFECRPRSFPAHTKNITIRGRVIMSKPDDVFSFELKEIVIPG